MVQAEGDVADAVEDVGAQQLRPGLTGGELDPGPRGVDDGRRGAPVERLDPDEHIGDRGLKPRELDPFPGEAGGSRVERAALEERVGQPLHDRLPHRAHALRHLQSDGQAHSGEHGSSPEQLVAARPRLADLEVRRPRLVRECAARRAQAEARRRSVSLRGPGGRRGGLGRRRQSQDVFGAHLLVGLFPGFGLALAEPGGLGPPARPPRRAGSGSGRTNPRTRGASRSRIRWDRSTRPASASKRARAKVGPNSLTISEGRAVGHVVLEHERVGEGGRARPAQRLAGKTRERLLRVRRGREIRVCRARNTASETSRAPAARTSSCSSRTRPRAPRASARARRRRPPPGIASSAPFAGARSCRPCPGPSRGPRGRGPPP